jgi:hypothetical protein
MPLLFFILPGFIYVIAIFFWCRYLYLHSFKKAADRDYFLDKFLMLAVYLPVGFQAILLFCYSLLQLIPLVKELTALAAVMFENRADGVPDFCPLVIILGGSLLVVVNYCLAVKAASFSSPLARIVSQVLVFAAGLFFLWFLRLNMAWAFSGAEESMGIKKYTNYYLLVPALVLVLFFAFIKGGWIYYRQSVELKYFSLASKILLFYVVLIIAVALPCLLYLLIKAGAEPA